MFTIFIPGTPKPQGSKNAYVRSGRAVMVEANKHLPEWRKAVVEALQGRTEHFEDAVLVEVAFWMPRPKTNKRKHPTTKPDVDKLQRAIGDCLTQAGIIKDDSYIVEWNARKMYADYHPAGVTISIYEM
jgi:crossover junction endodeoxyribonuclease RusA